MAYTGGVLLNVRTTISSDEVGLVYMYTGMCIIYGILCYFNPRRNIK